MSNVKRGIFKAAFRFEDCKREENVQIMQGQKMRPCRFKHYLVFTLRAAAFFLSFALPGRRPYIFSLKNATTPEGKEKCVLRKYVDNRREGKSTLILTGSPS